MTMTKNGIVDTRTRVQGNPLKGTLQTDSVANVDIFDDDSDDDRSKRLSKRDANGFSESYVASNPAVAQGADQKPQVPTPNTSVTVGQSPQFGGSKVIARI
jgi:hypothetical protein